MKFQNFPLMHKKSFTVQAPFLHKILRTIEFVLNFLSVLLRLHGCAFDTSNKLCAWRHNMSPPRPLYARCGPPPVHSLHALCLRRPARLAPWIFMIVRQRLALGGGVQTVDIRYVVTSTANQSGQVTLTLTFWSWKWCPSHVWRGLPLCQFWSS